MEAPPGRPSVKDGVKGPPRLSDDPSVLPLDSETKGLNRSSTVLDFWEKT